jgi:hypothetical protein
VLPELQLNEASAGHRNGRNAVIDNLQNIKPMFINGIEAVGHVARLGAEADDFWAVSWQGQVAPNSTFNFYVPLEGQRFLAGDYRVELEFVASNGSWTFSETFTLTEEEADALNEEAVGLIEPELPLWVYILMGAGGVLLLIAIILGVVWILNKRLNNKSQDAVETMMKQLNQEMNE